MKSVDRELFPSVRVTIVAKDHGTPAMVSNATLLVVITDVNDNKPVFKESEIKLSVSEDTRPGETLYGFRALDADSGANGRVRYRLSGQGQTGEFHLDPITG